VAFAFGRAFGPAVARNRIRRRLRAILRDLDQSSPLPPGVLLLGGRSQLIELTFDQLRAETAELLREVRSRAEVNA
jgi:ribonuclease P protein component